MLDRKYADLNYVIDDFDLVEESKYGATITWESSNQDLIKIVEPGAEESDTEQEPKATTPAAKSKATK